MAVSVKQYQFGRIFDQMKKEYGVIKYSNCSYMHYCIQYQRRI